MSEVQDYQVLIGFLFGFVAVAFLCIFAIGWFGRLFFDFFNGRNLNEYK